MKQNSNNKNPRSKWVSVVALLMALLMIGGVLLSALTAFAITQSEVNALKNKVAEATAKKNELKKQISAISGDISAIERQIALLDNQIEAQEEELAVQEELLEHLTVLIDEKTIELADSENRQAAQYERMKERIRFMAEHGNASYLSILLSADSFSDFLNRWEVVSQISVRDEQLFEELKAIRDRVTVEKQELETTKQEAEALKAQMEGNKADLESQRAAQEKKHKEAEDAKNAANTAYANMIEREDELMEQYKKAAAELAAQKTYVGGTFMWPLPAANNVVTCKWGMRTHPVTKKYKLHTGIDLRASKGTKIYAANAGTVTTAGYNSAYGYYVVISHGGGVATLYAHMSKMAVSKGQKVSQGTIIGYVGSTGYSTGPHLHFEVIKNGDYVNPISMYPGFSVVYS